MQAGKQLVALTTKEKVMSEAKSAAAVVAAIGPEKPWNLNTTSPAQAALLDNVAFDSQLIYSGGQPATFLITYQYSIVDGVPSHHADVIVHVTQNGTAQPIQVAYGKSVTVNGTNISVSTGHTKAVASGTSQQTV